MNGDVSSPVEISVVIPCYNEQDNVVPIAAAIIEVLERIGVTFDLIFIDNFSADATVERIRTLCASDARIRLIANARNFGQMRSPVHAVYASKGKAVIGIAADFQDPPELIAHFIERWRAGADIVLGVRQSEPTSLIHGIARSFSYWFAKNFGDYPVIPNATGFGLYDRRVVSAVATMREPEPFWRGLAIETGYTVETIEYKRPERARGKSNNNFFTLFDFAVSALSSFSKKTIRLPFAAALIFGVLSMLSLIAVPFAAFAGQSFVVWLIIGVVEFQFALLFGFLGLIGDQVRLVSERTRNAPLVFERERINFPEGY